jgi:hypothetical protein
MTHLIRQSWLKVKVKPESTEQAAANRITGNDNEDSLEVNVYKGPSNEFEQSKVGVNPDPEAVAFGKAN